MKKALILPGLLSGLCVLGLILFLTASPGYSFATDYGLPASPDKGTSFKSEAELALSALSPEEKCGQVLLVGVDGRTKPSARTAALLQKLDPGGVILFATNIGENTANVGHFIAGLQDAAAGADSGLPLIVAIDHEGGTVFRFKKGMTPVPSAASVGELGSVNGPLFAALLGRRAGLELRALGVNLALAPVVEVLNKENIYFLGTRSYGRDPALVDLASGAYIRGLESAGVGAVAKHFPGNATSDPHRRISSLNIDKESLESDYFARFAAADDAGVSCILLSHVLVPAVDSSRPATLSAPLIQNELRGSLHFEGVVITDDLYMGALAKRIKPEESAVEALKAGADLLMLSESEGALNIKNAICAALKSGALPEARLDEAVLHVLELKLRFNMAEGFDTELREKRLGELPAIVEESTKEIADFRAQMASNQQKQGKNSE